MRSPHLDIAAPEADCLGTADNCSSGASVRVNSPADMFDFNPCSKKAVKVLKRLKYGDILNKYFIGLKNNAAVLLGATEMQLHTQIERKVKQLGSLTSNSFPSQSA